MPDNLPATTQTSALATRFPILDPNAAEEIRQVIEANIGPRGLNPQQFDRIKVPSGGAQLWTVQTIDGEEGIKELSGIALAWCDSRIYYKTAFAERGKVRTPPDCTSKDGFYGIGDPGGECERCPMAAWGSDPKGGRGQACKQVRRLLFMRGDRILPEMITIPPTSLTNAARYFQRLVDYRIPYWGLITNIRLERIANADGVDYARMVFTAGERFDDVAKVTVAPYQAQIAALLHTTEVDADFEHGHDDDDSDGN